MEYKIILIEDKLKNLLPGNPFNLKNDFKNIDIKLKDLIIQEVVDQLHKGFNRKECSKLYYRKYENVFIILVKIRVRLEDGKKKTSLRCILIVDEFNELCLILHLYEKKNKENLTHMELKSAKKMLDYYYNELIKEYKDE